MNYKEQLDIIISNFSFSNVEKEELINNILPIYKHNEFQKRLDYNIYPHHNKTSLGMHILYTTILTYKHILKHKSRINKRLAIIIAMFHDLYEFPWQNNEIIKKSIFNYHGFVHPIEACINAYTWFPNYFNNEIESKIIIDGIIHHMYPFPVRRIDKYDSELNNKEKFDKLPKKIRKIIIESTNRNKFFRISFCKSKYKEGKIVSKMDKKATLIQDKINFYTLITLITGKNKNLNR